jgi:drug/metabolite transporter (DMT)-like permease
LRVTLAALIGVLFGVFEITNDGSPRALHLALGVVLIALAAAGWTRGVLLPWVRRRSG